MTSVIKSPCEAELAPVTAGASPAEPGAERWILAATILGSSMAFIDGTVVNVALPVLQQDLRATVADLQWVVEAYTLFLAALLLVGGALGDRYGRRRIFGLGVALFAAASLWCGLAPTIGQLILARAAQGVGGALLVPGSLAIISASFVGHARGRAIGTWSGATAITTALGPVLGGWMIENASWRLIFFINLPLAALVLLILYRAVPESKDDSVHTALDWPGALLITTGLGALVYGLIEASLLGLSHWRVLATVGLGIAALIGFLVVEARSPNAMMPLSTFRSRTFRGANLLTLLLYAGLGGAFFFLPFNLLQIQGYGATAAGAALLPMTLLLSGLSRFSGGLVDRWGPRLPLIVGPTVASIGFALFALPGVGGSYWTTFFPAIVVLGLGMALTVAPLTTVVMGAIEGRHAGLASGINNAVSRVAGLLAIAAFGIVAVERFGASLAARMQALGTPAALQQQILEQRVRLAALELPPEADAALRAAVAEAFVDVFRLIMLIAAGLALSSALIAMITIRPSDTPG